jgi:hypothetical protein
LDSGGHDDGSSGEQRAPASASMTCGYKLPDVELTSPNANDARAFSRSLTDRYGLPLRTTMAERYSGVPASRSISVTRGMSFTCCSACT